MENFFIYCFLVPIDPEIKKDIDDIFRTYAETERTGGGKTFLAKMMSNLLVSRFNIDIVTNDGGSVACNIDGTSIKKTSIWEYIYTQYILSQFVTANAKVMANVAEILKFTGLANSQIQNSKFS